MYIMYLLRAHRAFLVLLLVSCLVVMVLTHKVVSKHSCYVFAVVAVVVVVVVFFSLNHKLQSHSIPICMTYDSRRMD